MKHGKNPTKKQGIEIAKHGLNYKDWLVVSDTPKELVIVHRADESTVKALLKSRRSEADDVDG